MRQVQLAIKRLLDYLFGFLILIIILPIFIAICIAIKAADSGPVFFRQKRIGRNGCVFEIIKFRTMILNAEEQGDGLVVKTESDPRITKVGRLLRKSSLDELPQLINVLHGEMSLIGPRPPVTYHPYVGYHNYPIEARKRFEMRPGITGLAQVRKRNSATWDERIAVDLEYVEKFSLLLDFKIFFRTFLSMRYSEKYTGQNK